MVDDELEASFAADINELWLAGLRPVVVHGGGPQIQSLLDRLGIESEFRAGLRVTSAETLEAVRMVLVGQVARKLVNVLNADAARAVGISGEDGVTLRCVRHIPLDGDVEVDLGFVGDVESVDPSLIDELLANGRIPVISSVGVDRNRNTYNINADAAAGAVAGALGAKRLVMMTNVAGLHRNWPHSEEVVEQLTCSELIAMLPDLADGMIPKLRACADAVTAGVERATIVDGRVPGIVRQVLANAPVGTVVVGDQS
jgi:acetylglutamate kinase